MSREEYQITSVDILSNKIFAGQRADRRRALIPIKKLRRISLGPHCTFYFESYETMLFQVQEMLYIEGAHSGQLEDELSAYNPLIPKGDELVATMMFEIDDPVRRLNILRGLGGIEDHVFIRIGDERVMGVPEDDVERTSEDGKTSSVHFFHFSFSKDQKRAFLNEENEVFVGADHANYAHLAVIPMAGRVELARDFS